MAIAFTAATNNGFANNAGTRSLTINRPAYTSGDVFICAIVAVACNHITPPSGWTTLGQVTQKASTKNVTDKQATCAVFYKLTGGGEAASYTFNFDANVLSCSGGISGYSGVRNLDIASSLFSGLQRGTTWASSLLTTRGTEEEIIRVGAAANYGGDFFTTIGTLGGHSKRVNRCDHYVTGFIAHSTGLTIQDQFQSGTGTAPNLLFTIDGPTYEAFCMTLALNPTNRAPVSTNLSPLDGYTYNIAGTPTFQWKYDDPDGITDTQTAWALQRSSDGGSTWNWYNVGTGLWQGSEVYNTSVNNWFAFPSGKWANGTTYLWKVAVKDQAGQASAYSTATTVVGGVPPQTVVMTGPDQPWHASQEPIVEWTLTGGTQSQFQVKVFKVATTLLSTFNVDVMDGVWDSGLINSASKSIQILLDLDPGTAYVAYLRTVVGTSVLDWQSKQFVIDISVGAIAPSVAAIVTAPDAQGTRNNVRATLNSNILTTDDASFVTATGTWGIIQNVSTIARSTAQQVRGEGAMLVTAAAAVTDAIVATGLYPIKPSTDVTAYAKVWQNTGGNKNMGVGFRWYDGNGRFISETYSTTSVANTTWTQVALDTTSPSNAFFMALAVKEFAAPNAATYYVDDAAILFSGSRTWARGGTIFGQMLPYASSTFEGVANDGTADAGWEDPAGFFTVGGSFTVQAVSTAFQGLQYLLIQYALSSSISPPSGTPYFQLDHSLPVRVGQQYTFVAQLNGTNGRHPQLALSWRDEDDNEIAVSKGQFGPTTTTAFGSNWTQFFVTDEAPAGTSFVRPQVWFPDIVVGDGFQMDAAMLSPGFVKVFDPVPALFMYPEVLYSDDSGQSWDFVRGFKRPLPNLDKNLGAYLQNRVDDYEAPVGTRQYRARIATQDQTEATDRLTTIGQSGAYVTGTAIQPSQGDLDITFSVAPDTYVFAPNSYSIVSCRTGAAAATTMFDLYIGTNGHLLLDYSDGTTLTTGIDFGNLFGTFTTAERCYVRILLIANDGSGHHIAYMWTSHDGVTWTQTSATTASALGRINTLNHVLEIGAATNGTTNPFNGDIYYVSVKDGAGGPELARFDPSEQSDYTESTWTDPRGNTWTIQAGSNGGPGLLQTDGNFSGWSQSASAVTVTTGDWWLKDPTTPSNNMKLFISGDNNSGIQFKGKTTNAQFDVMGRPDWVVINDTWKMDDITFKSKLFQTDMTSLEKLRSLNRTLVLQSDYGPQYYIQFNERDKELVNTNQEFDDLDLNFTQVKRPAVVAP